MKKVKTFEAESVGNVWTDVRPVEDVNNDWFVKHGFTEEDIRMFLEGYNILPTVDNERSYYRFGQVITGIPIYVEWSHAWTAFVDYKGRLHTAQGTTQKWRKRKFKFVGDTSGCAWSGSDHLWKFD